MDGAAADLVMFDTDYQHPGSKNEVWKTSENRAVLLSNPNLESVVKPRKLEPLNNPAVKLGHLPPLQQPPIIDTQKGQITSFGMDRQNSTTPLVDSARMERSYTAAELANELHKEKVVQTSLVRKNSQVQPITCKELEANGTCQTPTEESTKSAQDTCCWMAAKVTTSLLVGIYFGWFLQKSTVYKPEVIRNQFLFKEFIMLKTFLAALFSSQFCILMLSLIPPTKSYVESARQAFANTFCFKGIISSLFGAFVLGAGMAVAGACPGMVLAQNGSLVPNSAYTTLGGFIGCLAYGFLHPLLIKMTTPSQPYSTQFIYEKLKVPFVALVIPSIILCLAAVTLMEVFIPETQNSKKDQRSQTNLSPDAVNSTNMLRPSLPLCEDDSVWFTQEMWSPAACGTMIGLVQIPIILIFSDTMGSSSGYLTVVSQWVVTKRLKSMFPYFDNARAGIQNYWMMLYILGAAGGGALGALSSCSFLKAPGVPWWQALLGGFLMLFGARLSSGCTSGHGISGTALLVGLSWLAVPAMFSGGIATIFIMEYSGTNLYTTTWQP